MAPPQEIAQVELPRRTHSTKAPGAVASLVQVCQDPDHGIQDGCGHLGVQCACMGREQLSRLPSGCVTACGSQCMALFMYSRAWLLADGQQAHEAAGMAMPQDAGWKEVSGQFTLGAMITAHASGQVAGLPEISLRSWEVSSAMLTRVNLFRKLRGKPLQHSRPVSLYVQACAVHQSDMAFAPVHACRGCAAENCKHAARAARTQAPSPCFG